MAEIWSRIKAVWESAKTGESKTRVHAIIDPSHCDSSLGQPFVERRQYLQIVINEMFLSASRKWFVEYEPMTMVTTTYLYDKAMQTSPFVVGPSMLKNKELGTKDVVFRNTPVTTLHPYQGGPLTLTVLFSAVRQANNADKVFRAVEGIGSVVDPLAPAIQFASYLRIADKVMDGIEVLLGLQETQPLLGYQVTINPDIGQPLTPHHLVLIDADERELDPTQLWVKDSRLHYGPSLADAQPYRAHDFVLLQVAQASARSDERTLGFYPLWEKTTELALQSGDDHYWKEAKAHFNTLKRQLRASPDLTEPDYQRLRDTYKRALIEMRKEAVADNDLSGDPSRTTRSPIEAEMARIAAELDALDEP